MCVGTGGPEISPHLKHRDWKHVIHARLYDQECVLKRGKSWTIRPVDTIGSDYIHMLGGTPQTNLPTNHTPLPLE